MLSIVTGVEEVLERRARGHTVHECEGNKARSLLTRATLHLYSKSTKEMGSLYLLTMSEKAYHEVAHARPFL